MNENKNIFLINAPVEFGKSGKGEAIPLGLSYISSYLKSKQLDVKGIDMSYQDISEQDLIEFLKQINPTIIGISFTTHSRETVPGIISIIRKTLAKTHITIGGHHVTSAQYDTLLNLDTDSIVVGDGEVAMYNLAIAIFSDFNSKKLIEGVYYKSDIENYSEDYYFKPAFIDDISNLPWADRMIFNTDHYSLNFAHKEYKSLKKIDYIITSRGCPFKCRFCSTHISHGLQKVRYRPINDVVDEIEYLIKELKCDGLYIYDDHFMLNKKRVNEFIDEMTKRKLFIPMTCYSRVDAINEDLLKSLYKIGVRIISFGIESGSQRILDYLEKKTDETKIENAIKMCSEVGILPKGSFITASPTETIVDYKKTINMVARLQKIAPDFQANLGGVGMLIHPGTGIYYDALKNNVLPKNFSWFKKYDNLYEYIGTYVYSDATSEKLLRDILIFKIKEGIKYIFNPQKSLFHLIKMPKKYQHKFPFSILYQKILKQ